MRSRAFQLLFILISAWLATRSVQSRQETTDEALARAAYALIEAQCLQCHGAEKMSGLDLRTRDSALAGGSRGSSLLPGRGAESRLYRMVAGLDRPEMPLGGKLSADQIALLRNWIDRGAHWPSRASRTPSSATADRDYWAFRRAARPGVPIVRDRAWARNPVDHFILAGLEAKGLRPSPPADRVTLLRRVTFDLTGLPPTPEEIAAFLSDRTSDAYEKVVKRLLDSPRYGERMAQHWLDVVRFAETNGFELDQDREGAWRYRDYVIDSFNRDLPYDQFLREQIAGDELSPADFRMRVATGFLRAGPQHVVAGNQDLAVNRQEWLTEAVNGIGNGVLGLTIGCARCHDHKFDPIPQADYYRLQAFFAATDNEDCRFPTKAEQSAYEAAVKAHEERLKPIKDAIEAIEKPVRDRLRGEKRARLEPAYVSALALAEEKRTEEQQRLAKDAMRMLNVSWDELVAAIEAKDKERRAALRQRLHRIELEAPEPLAVALGVSDKIAPIPAMHILKGGDPHAPGAAVEPRFPGAIKFPDRSDERIAPGMAGTGRRTALARWLTRPDHPLTPRVLVNRLWHYHFGRGIVATPNDFGRNGGQPTHPGLLDYLAAEFVSGRWSVKRIHELIVLSNAYRQSSAYDPARARLDPENKLIWRMNRQRLDAESLRDAILAVSGSLNLKMGGRPVRVPLEPEVYDTIFTEAEPDNLWPVTPDAREHTRRSLYLLRKRNVRLPMMVAFDAPDLMSSCAARSQSVHALQALTLLNSDFIRVESRALARRLYREASGEPEMIERLYLLSLGRKPRSDERELAVGFLRDQTRIIRERLARGEAVTRIETVKADPARVAAWVDLAQATINLNEFLYLK
jgi:hypothetical protein